MSIVKNLLRKAIRAYLTYTPIKKGRYPLMMAAHKYFSEPVTVEVETKDRGKMILDLDDEAQFPLYYNIYEWRDTPILKSLADKANVILDIGGNIGQMALFFAQFANKVYTFEPIPFIASKLRQNIKLNNLNSKIILSQIALSNSKGKIKFGLPPNKNRGTGSTILTDQNKNNIIEVDSLTLDEFIGQNKITGIDLIKMDIEGAELFALQGMVQLLSRENNKPILILEMTISMMNKGGYTPKDLLRFLEQFGYKCYQFSGKGLVGPAVEVHPQSENYCFLTDSHLQLPNVQKILA
jgi:FkbM family methyltransferase